MFSRLSNRAIYMYSVHTSAFLLNSTNVMEEKWQTCAYALRFISCSVYFIFYVFFPHEQLTKNLWLLEICGKWFRSIRTLFPNNTYVHEWLQKTRHNINVLSGKWPNVLCLLSAWIEWKTHSHASKSPPIGRTAREGDI